MTLLLTCDTLHLPPTPPPPPQAALGKNWALCAAHIMHANVRLGVTDWAQDRQASVRQVGRGFRLDNCSYGWQKFQDRQALHTSLAEVPG
jgi:hypothetical protein